MLVGTSQEKEAGGGEALEEDGNRVDGWEEGTEQTEPRQRKGLNQEQRMAQEGSHSPLGMQNLLESGNQPSGPDSACGLLCDRGEPLSSLGPIFHLKR